MLLVQYKDNKIYVHGSNDTVPAVSELIAFYYKYKKQHGYMEIIDENDNNRVLVTLGSKGVNHNE